jgi:hypothetical protein
MIDASSGKQSSASGGKPLLGALQPVANTASQAASGDATDQVGICDQSDKDSCSGNAKVVSSDATSQHEQHQEASTSARIFNVLMTWLVYLQSDMVLIHRQDARSDHIRT